MRLDRAILALWVAFSGVASAQADAGEALPATEKGSDTPNTPNTPCAPTPTEKTIREEVSIPAEAMAKALTDASPGGQAGIGLEYRLKVESTSEKPAKGEGEFALRARINLGGSAFELKTLPELAALILQPDLKGASIAADVTWAGTVSSRLSIAIASAFRLSPTLKWVAPSGDARGAIAGVVQSAALVRFAIPGPEGELKKRGVSFELHLPVSLHFLAGEIVAPGNGEFRLVTLGTYSTSFFSFAPRIVIRVGDFGLFAAASLATDLQYFNHQGSVSGLTGFNALFGVDVRGAVLAWTLGDRGATTGKQQANKGDDQSGAAERPGAAFSAL